MKNKKIAVLLAVCIGSVLLSGCTGEKQKIYEQAVKDLSEGSYEYALQGYAQCVENGVKLPESYRGAGIADLRMGNLEDAITNFTSALACDKVSKALKKDIYLYRATACFKAERYEEAMADCQTLMESFDMDADCYFLTGKTALFMDGYDEAATNFEKAYKEDSTYDRAIQIYEVYLDRDMEADGVHYLELALDTQPKTAEDYCSRGQVYYYMQDYDNARKELTEASQKNSLEALLLLGMVYLAQNDLSNARAMYQQYISAGGNAAKAYNGLAMCDIREQAYDSALSNIASGIGAADLEDLESLLFNEIVVYEKLLDFNTALSKAREYIEMFPEDEAIQKEISFLETRVA